MPATRLSSTKSTSEPRRRRSSHLLQPTPTVKPGLYGLHNRPIAFAPNVTPGTFVELDSTAPAVPPTAAVLFPPSDRPTQQASRKRHPPGKRPSQGYIPRPPNAFMLFRADFVKQRHVPGSIETNHGSLSKIIGNCWRQLPLDERRYWEQRAKEEKQQHKIRHPDYRFRPVHNKNKNKDGSKGGANLSVARKEKPQQTQEEELRCDAVAALLLEGKKGDELAQAVRNLDMARNTFASISREGTISARGSMSSTMATPPPPYFNFCGQAAPQYASGLGFRRPSSVPLPDAWLSGLGSALVPNQVQYPMSMPTTNVQFLSSSRPVSPSPVTGISFAAQQQQSHDRLVLRRPSSAQPMGMVGRRSWTTPYEGYTTMPFFQDLGIENPFGNLHSDQQHEGAEIAGEPDYALFNGFSFAQSNETPVANLPISHDPSAPNSVTVGPHDLPPNLNISMEQVGWTGDVEPALHSASSLASSSTAITISSHESSPTPSDMYSSTTESGMFTQSGQMYAIDANYDIGLTSFDISPLDLTMAMAHDAGYSHESAYSFDTAGMVDPILHAPKPLLANERTPTKMVFGQEVEDYISIQ